MYEKSRSGSNSGFKNGPLFFDIYYSDFARLCSRDEIMLYVDDTVLVYVDKSLEELIDHINNRSCIIFEWCKFKKLLLNPKKSEIMGVKNKRLIAR